MYVYNKRNISRSWYNFKNVSPMFKARSVVIYIESEVTKKKVFFTQLGLLKCDFFQLFFSMRQIKFWC